MPFLKYRNTGRRVPVRARKAFRGRLRRRRRPMTTGKVKRIIDVELKVRDLGVGPIPVASPAGIIINISSVGQGDANDQRNGNWIKPTSWMGTITMQGNSAQVGIATSLYRVGVVCWKENESLNAISLPQIMQDPLAPHQQFNIENKGQFKILWSRTGILSNNDDNPQFQKIHRFYVKLPMKVLFDGADEKNNQLFLFATTQIDIANDPPTIQFDTRLRYTDS